MNLNISPDDVCWAQAETISDTWLLQFLEIDILRPIADFILLHNRGNATEFAILRKGSYNISLRLKYDPNGATVIRFPQPGAVLFPEEKIVNEVSVMRFLADQTTIPIPFILMEYIEHETKLYDALNTPGLPREQRGVLDPDIAEAKLRRLYAQMADVLLQLSLPALPRIGSLSQQDDFTWEVTRRPLSMNMNELVRLGCLPRSQLPHIDTTFPTASSYVQFLADLNLDHLIHQRNDAVTSADDCRRKYVARCLFRSLAREQRLTTPALENGPFNLWCDDLRPANVLLSQDLQIAGVVDWEFTYAAPVEFSHAPPWWLLIERPEEWAGGIEEWTRVFGARLRTFLEVMTECEDRAIQRGRLHEGQRLSGAMRRSWESGDFWVMYALRNSFAFDLVYWLKIDERFFGVSGRGVERAWEERVGMLSEEEKEEMEMLLTRKMAERASRPHVWDADEYTLAFQRELERRREGDEGGKDEDGVDGSRGVEDNGTGADGMD
ncbi:phosphotransferase family protein [Aspergillus aculeatinus CBS 121060]|uniref:phosphotransferase family protein n=1 Tax=Aspergillus aculeatinus CBS 121060 TaxID=1448322 RepID=UPI000DBD44CD|nr:phosphotransferase family protein [Aspergillus aculeatinus CBS 121060]RAH68651.1 phosphotransferase family protein [Aspergillus aculeatinus CBS 121060]